MHSPPYQWYSLGAPESDPLPPARRQGGQRTEPGCYRFSLGALSVATSTDGWMRLRIALDRVPVARRSWALDPQAEASRAWTPVEIPPPTEQTSRSATRIVAFDDGVAESESNPHEDTRGLIAETVGGTFVTIRICGAASDPTARRADDSYISALICRSRDGIRVDLPTAARTRVYGLGEKTGGLNKRGRTWAFWNTDEPLQIASRDPLYQSIPVAYLFEPKATLTIFSDSPAHQYFDGGESDADAFRIEVYDDQADLYLRRDTALPEAVAAYTGLTCRLPMPPE